MTPPRKRSEARGEVKWSQGMGQKRKFHLNRRKMSNDAACCVSLAEYMGNAYINPKKGVKTQHAESH